MPAEPVQHIVMIGAMGCGKTTIGRLVASELSRPFLDNDRALITQEHSTAAQVADEYGLVALHRMEANLLLEQVDSTPPAVIAAAASVIEDPRAIAALTDHATTVWLRGDPTLVTHRAQRSGHRPLLDDPQLMISLAEQRAAAYGRVADLVIDVSGATPIDSAHRVEEFLRSRS